MQAKPTLGGASLTEIPSTANGGRRVNRIGAVESTAGGCGRDASQQQIRWNSQHGLLVDFVTDKDVHAFLAGDTKTCRQYSFKLTTLFYACCLLGLDREFPTELEKIRQRLVSAQLKSGGIAHFFDVEAQSDAVHACPDATGEATAIYILSMAIVPNQIARK